MCKGQSCPLKPITIPRLELNVAVTGLKLGVQVHNELGMDCHMFFFTDSTAVLHYISNDQPRWPIFVANRVALIREHSEPSQWHHVSSENNPADLASRGTKPAELGSLWWNGPSFLQEAQ